MGSLWNWFKGKGHANAKPVAGDVDAPVPPPRDVPPRAIEAAIDRAETKWAKDGERADQDYYHVPGGMDQGLKGSPEAQRKPRNAPRSKLPR